MSFVQQLLASWGELGSTPEGRERFDQQLASLVPYSGTIEPHVLELSPGHALVAMDDRPSVRNHLDSLHAVAIMNLGEVTTGLALLAGLPADARAILVGLSIDYHNKARGRLVASCDCTPPADNSKTRCEISARLLDESGEEVATATARWAVGPV